MSCWTKWCWRDLKTLSILCNDVRIGPFGWQNFVHNIESQRKQTFLIRFFSFGLWDVWILVKGVKLGGRLRRPSKFQESFFFLCIQHQTQKRRLDVQTHSSNYRGITDIEGRLDSPQNITKQKQISVLSKMRLNHTEFRGNRSIDLSADIDIVPSFWRNQSEQLACRDNICGQKNLSLHSQRQSYANTIRKCNPPYMHIIQQSRSSCLKVKPNIL